MVNFRLFMIDKSINQGSKATVTNDLATLIGWTGILLAVLAEPGTGPCFTD